MSPELRDQMNECVDNSRTSVLSRINLNAISSIYDSADPKGSQAALPQALAIESKRKKFN